MLALSVSVALFVGSAFFKIHAAVSINIPCTKSADIVLRCLLLSNLNVMRGSKNSG